MPGERGGGVDLPLLVLRAKKGHHGGVGFSQGLTQSRDVAVTENAPSSGDEALLEAVTKSAYDAAVYDLRVLAPEGDAGAAAALGVKQYTPHPERVYARTLGSRSQP